MKRLAAIALLLSTTVFADDGAAVVTEPEEAKISHKEWPSLNELWNETETGDGIKQALVNGTLGLNLLLGYEYVDEDNNGRDEAHGVITRTRLNYLTGEYKGFSAFVQAQYVGPINDHFSPKDPEYDTINDPEEFRFHQVYLAYSGYDSTAQFGSQEILLDNQRFIGNVGWRLNAQSFNAASVANHSISNITLYYAYADSINRIDGDTDHDRQYHLFNAEWQACESSSVAAFAYLQRNDGSGSLDQLDTYGARLWGASDIVRHEVMIALQRDAYYGSIFGEFDFDGFEMGGGIEYISGGNDGGERFRTLDGTGHKFNGWADQFLGTGGGLEGGLIDFYGQISAMVFEDLKLMGVYHYFNTADETDGGFDGDYGQEVDLLAKYPICPNFDVLAKLAYYKQGDDTADNFTEDKTVFWLRGELRF
jgi:hypothetical protein